MVIVLPLSQLLVKQMNVVRDAVLVQELLELLVIDAVGSFDLAVQMWGARPDVDVPDVERVEMPVELGLKFRAIVGWNDVDAEGQSPADPRR